MSRSRWMGVVLSVGLLAVLGVSSYRSGEGLGAQESGVATVADNQFEATEHTPVGVYGLTVLPVDGGTSLRPGDRAEVSMRALDVGRYEHRYRAGDQLVRSVVLPRSLTPVDVPPQWRSEQSAEGIWTVTHTQNFQSAVKVTHAASEVISFGVSVSDDENVGPEMVYATATLPEQFTSTHAEDQVQIVVGSVIVDLGVYKLQVDTDVLIPGNPTQLSFDTHPDDSLGTSNLRNGDVISHTINYPKGMTHSELPPLETYSDRTVEWSSDSTDTLTRTVTVTGGDVFLSPETIAISVDIGASIERFSQIMVSAKLGNLVSTRGEQILNIRGVVVRPDTIVAGRSHNLLLDEDGAAYGWGLNAGMAMGALGVGDTISRRHLTKVDTDARFVSLAATRSASAGVTAEGEIYIWGTADSMGPERTMVSPVKLDTDVRLRQIYAGSGGSWMWDPSMFGLAEDGTAYAWGSNTSGQLGIGYSGGLDIGLPVEVKTDVRFDELYVTSDYVLGREKITGDLYGWGNNGNGQLGGGPSLLLEPTLMETGLNFTTLSLHNKSVLALTDDGELYGWGDASSGIFGSDFTGNLDDPTLIPFGVHWVGLSRGSDFDSNLKPHVFGFAQDGTVYSWGDNRYGQLGDPEFEGDKRLAPGPVVSEVPFTSVVTAGGRASFGISDNGSYGCGKNTDGRLGTVDRSQLVREFSRIF